MAIDREALDRPVLTVHPRLRSAFRALNQAGICWALLRGEDELRDPGADVDLLVAPQDAADLERVLRGEEFLRAVAYDVPGSHAFFVGYSDLDDRWIRLDVVSELAFGPRFTLTTNLAASCLARRQLSDEVSRLAPGDRFWALLLHCLLDKGRFADHRAAALLKLATTEETDSRLSTVVEPLCPADWTSTRIVEHVRRGDWPALEQLATQLRAALPAASAETPTRTSLGTRALDVVRRARFRLRHPGICVAILGPDGAGKSTLADGIRNSFYFPTRVIYMGVWTSRMNPPPLLPIPGWYLGTQVLRSWRRYLVARWHRSLGRLVIFDRHILDVLVPSASFWTRRGLLDWLLGHACPAPDLVLVLDVPAEIMFQRKQEHDPTHLDAQRQRLLSLKSRISNVEVVDGLVPPDSVRRDAVTRIWRRYVKQWSKR